MRDHTDEADDELHDAEPEAPHSSLLEALTAAPDRASLETSEALYRIGTCLAAAAGALEERDERILHFARFRIGDGPAEHGLTDLLDDVIATLGALPGADRAELRRRRRASHAACHALRGPAYLARTITLLSDAAAAALSLARALPPAEMAERQALLAIAGHLSWCARRDAADHDLYV